MIRSVAKGVPLVRLTKQKEESKMNKANHITAVIAGLAIVAATSGLAVGQSVEDWNKVIAAAKKERKVVIYGTTTVRDFSLKIASKFKKRYGVTVEYLSGRSREVRERPNPPGRPGRGPRCAAPRGASLALGLRGWPGTAVRVGGRAGCYWSSLATRHLDQAR